MMTHLAQSAERTFRPRWDRVGQRLVVIESPGNGTCVSVERKSGEVMKVYGAMTTDGCNQGVD